MLNIEAKARTFKLLWHTKKGFEARDMGDHCVLFVFSEQSDVDRVLAGEPWSFDKNLVALKRMRRQSEMKGLVYDSACFSIQVHDLPISSLKLHVAQSIVSVAGEVIHMDGGEEDFESSHFVRVRVRLDITKPLCRGRKIGLSNGEDGWAGFKYERLPNLCYWCGRLTHQDRDCSIWVARKGSVQGSGQQYGSWLRASTPNLAKKTVIRVEGYEEPRQEDEGPVSHSEHSEEEDGVTLNAAHGIGAEDSNHGVEKESESERLDETPCEGAGPTVLEDDRRNVSAPIKCMDIGQPRGLTSQNFHAQLDEIDAEIGRLDGGMDCGEQHQVWKDNGLGARLEKSVDYASFQHDNGTVSVDLGSLKRPREVSSEELGIAKVSRKKQAVVIKTQSVEADAQPRRQP